jgi:hypothetical protein
MRFASDKYSAALLALLLAVILLSTLVGACSGGPHSVIAPIRSNERLETRHEPGNTHAEAYPHPYLVAQIVYANASA